MPKARALFVGSYLDPCLPFVEGHNKTTLLLAQQLVSLDVDVWALALSENVHSFLELERKWGITYVVLNKRRLLRERYRPRFVRVLIDCLQLALGSDVVCFFNRYFPPVFARGQRWLWISVHHSFDVVVPVNEETVIFAENTVLYRRARERYPNNSVHLRYPGVDLTSYCPKSSRDPQIPVRFLFASSPLPMHDTAKKEEIILQNRGVHGILEVSERLGRHIPVETVLLWRKDPSYIRSLLPSSGTVRVVSEPISDMSAYMEAFDFCFCLFHDRYHVKGVPQSMIESLAKGLPVVAFRGTSFGDLVDCYRAGVTVSDPVTERDVQTLLEVCTNGEHYRRLSEGAVRCAQERFDIQREAQEILALLQGGQE